MTTGRNRGPWRGNAVRDSRERVPHSGLFSARRGVDDLAEQHAGLLSVEGGGCVR